jgi:hypothetical protein
MKTLKGQMDEMQQDLKSWHSLAEKMKAVIDRQEQEKKHFWESHIREVSWYQNKYGLSEPTMKKIEQAKRQIDALLPDADEYIPGYHS